MRGHTSTRSTHVQVSVYSARSRPFSRASLIPVTKKRFFYTSRFDDSYMCYARTLYWIFWVDTSIWFETHHRVARSSGFIHNCMYMDGSTANCMYRSNIYSKCVRRVPPGNWQPRGSHLTRRSKRSLEAAKIFGLEEVGCTRRHVPRSDPGMRFAGTSILS